MINVTMCNLTRSVGTAVSCSVEPGPVWGLVMAAALALVLVPPCHAQTQATGLPAFPGAEGFGAQAVGGRGGKVIEVTNLNTDGPGSLREAVAAEGPRIVVFRVSGIIDLKGNLTIREPYLTIAGQTAPGDGICLRGGTLNVGAHDVIIRYLRVRVGDSPNGPNPENRDAIDVAGAADKVYNVIIDHCSCSWAMDETVTTWGDPRNVTIQWCIISEALMDSLHPQGLHSTGNLVGSGKSSVTVHHCLLAHNSGRNPLLSASGPSTTDWRNNVVYNYGGGASGTTRGPLHVNYVGNYIKVGPNGGEPGTLNIRPNEDQLYFVEDNIWPGRHEQAEDWMVLGPASAEPPSHLLSATPIAVPPVTTESAASVYESVLRLVGATLPVRDVVDARVIEEVRTGTGFIIDTQADVGGWPQYRSEPPPPDSDHDGMPDAWERQYALDPEDPADGPGDLDGDGYTNVEEYLNATSPTEETTGSPLPQTEPIVQQGNEALRFGVARVKPEPVAYVPADRQEFVNAVTVSGQEVADYLGLTLVQLPAGEFVKGYAEAEIKVTLTKPFEIGAYEVTQGQWTAVMGTKPWLDKEFAQDAPDNAVTYVSWDDCQEFLARLNACGDRQYRLPTEAEFDYANRAGAAPEIVFWLDKDDIGEYAWYANNALRAGEIYAHAVGQKKPNPWGLFDMTGNALEWCHDWYEYSYWRKGPDRVDPMGVEAPSGGRQFHVVRGGSLIYTLAQFLREYDRSDGDPSKQHRAGYRNFDAGFRVVRLAP